MGHGLLLLLLAALALCRASVPVLADKTPTTLLEEFGYPSDVHSVETEDGYILRLDRIPNEGKPVVYLTHALETSAAAFLLLGPEKALALILYDAGYDVWLGNFRGNRYSRSHVSLTTSDRAFWNFSWDEHGRYDNTANIDYILNATGKSDLLYVGHSMGCTSFLVTASTCQEYQKKIKAAFLLAPPASIANHKSLFVSMLKDYVKMYEFLFGSIRNRETPYSFYASLANKLCKKAGFICNKALDLVVGKNPSANYWTTIPNLFDYIPAGGSDGQIVHYLQLTKKKDVGFRYYDYGKKTNKILYSGKTTPPDYNLTAIALPVYMYNGANDILVDPTIYETAFLWCLHPFKFFSLHDLDFLRAVLPNLKGDYTAPDKNFNHVDFIFADYAKEQVFDVLLEDMEQYQE